MGVFNWISVHLFTCLSGSIPTKPGSATLPFFGIEPAVLDAQTGMAQLFSSLFSSSPFQRTFISSLLVELLLFFSSLLLLCFSSLCFCFYSRAYASLLFFSITFFSPCFLFFSSSSNFSDFFFLSGKELEGPNVSGVLAFKRPWPGMARTVYGDHPRYLA